MPNMIIVIFMPLISHPAPGIFSTRLHVLMEARLNVRIPAPDALPHTKHIASLEVSACFRSCEQPSKVYKILGFKHFQKLAVCMFCDFRNLACKPLGFASILGRALRARPFSLLLRIINTKYEFPPQKANFRNSNIKPKITLNATLVFNIDAITPRICVLLDNRQLQTTLFHALISLIMLQAPCFAARSLATYTPSTSLGPRQRCCNI